MSLIFPSTAISSVKILTGYLTLKIPPRSNRVLQYRTKTESTYEYKIEQPYKLHKLKTSPPLKTTITNAEALKLYENMLTIRLIENACADLYKAKYIRGFCHLYAGEEAVAAGIHLIIRNNDSLITAYRCHGFTYLMSGSALGVISELTGRRTGIVRGKGGSMHMYANRFYGGNGIVGSSVPLGVGVAFSHKYNGDGGVCFNLYGDGAANQGQVFEAMNIAKLWTLPCVFVCENNGYGLGTSAVRSSASTDYYTRGDYIPGIYVDGMDVIACRDATRFCFEYVVSGKGPIVMEAETYRYYGHSMSDPGTSYRTREEVRQVRNTRDPIILFRRKILENKAVIPEQLEAVDKKVTSQVQEVVEQSKTEPPVEPEELSADVFKLCLYPNQMVRGVHPGRPLKHISVSK